MKKVRNLIARTLFGTDAESIRGTIEAAIVAREQDPSFERAYGRFMIAWADAEAELYRVLCAYAEVSDDVARAIFSGTRAGTMIEHIRAIAHNTEMAQERVADLEHVFPQIAAINKARDLLAHYATNSYGFDPARPTFRAVTNADRVSRRGKERFDWVGVETLEAMTADLHGIGNHLNMHWGRRLGPFRPWRENDPSDPATPWLYKSPQPASDRHRSPPGARKREGPQKSSRKKS